MDPTRCTIEVVRSKGSSRHRPYSWQRSEGAMKVSLCLHLASMLHKMSIARCGDKPTLIAESTTEVMLKNRANVFVIITIVADRSLLLYAWWMKSVTELIEKEYLLLILNTVISLWCWWGVGLYVQTAVWCGFVITSIVIIEFSTFIMQHQLMNFVMLASNIIIKSTLCVQYATKA